MGVIQLSLGSVSVIVGVLSLVYGVPTGSFPFVVGVGIWVGVLVLIAGLFGLLASRQADTREGKVTLKAKAFVICNYLFSLFCVIFGIAMPVFGGLGIHYCLNPGSVIMVGGRGSPIRAVTIHCDPNENANLALSGVYLGLGILIFLVSIPFTVFFCCYARVFGFKSTRDQRMEMQRMRRQIADLQQQVAASNNRYSTSY